MPIRHVFTDPSPDSTITSIVRPSDWNSGHAYTLVDGISLLGNTAGVLANVSSGTFYLAGGNNVTLSQQGNSITISAPNQSAPPTSEFDGGMSNLGNTAGTSGTVSRALFLAGGNNLTLSQSINGQSATVTISAFNQSLQPSSEFDGGISNLGNSAGTSGTVSRAVYFAGGNNVTLSQSVNGQSATITISAFNAPAQSQESQTLGMSNLGNSAGTSGVVSAAQARYLFAGGNNVTLSQSLNGASGTLTISAANQTVESNTFGMSNLGNSSGTSGVASGGQVQLLFAGGNNVTLSQSLNGVSGTITISAFNQSNPPTSEFDAGMSNLGNTAGTSGTVSRALFLAGGNNVTLSQSINGQSATVTVSAFNAPAQTVESNTFGMSNLGNTSGTSGVVSAAQAQYLFAGGNRVTLSQSLNGASGTLTISVGNQTVESNTFGMSNLGNTAGTSGVVSADQVRVLFAGGNNITLSQSLNGASATITISAPNIGAGNAFLAGVSNLGNTLGTSGTVSQQVVLVGGDYVTLSQSVNGQSATVTISAGQNLRSFYYNIDPGMVNAGVVSLTGASQSRRPIFWPLWVPGSIQARSIEFWGSRPAGTSLNMTHGIAFYGVSNSTALTLVSSLTEAVSLTTSAQFSGVRVYQFVGLSNLTLTPGRYVAAYLISGSNSSTAVANLVMMGANTVINVVGSVFSGTNTTAASNDTNFVVPFWGVLSATSDGFPGTVGASDILGGATNARQVQPYLGVRAA